MVNVVEDVIEKKNNKNREVKNGRCNSKNEKRKIYAGKLE